jgi:hypothetical protein
LRERKDSKTIKSADQVRVKAKDRMTVVKMAATKAAPEPALKCNLLMGAKVMTLTLGHFLSLGAMLFALSVVGIFLNRKNLIVLMMAIELMLLGG